jgi:hypothetical protein
MRDTGTMVSMGVARVRGPVSTARTTTSPHLKRRTAPYSRLGGTPGCAVLCGSAGFLMDAGGDRMGKRRMAPYSRLGGTPGFAVLCGSAGFWMDGAGDRMGKRRMAPYSRLGGTPGFAVLCGSAGFWMDGAGDRMGKRRMAPYSRLRPYEFLACNKKPGFPPW